MSIRDFPVVPDVPFAPPCQASCSLRSLVRGSQHFCWCDLLALMVLTKIREDIPFVLLTGSRGSVGANQGLAFPEACFGVGQHAGQPSGTKCCDSTLGAPFTSRQAGKKKECVLCIASSQAQGTGGFAGGARQGWATQHYLPPSFPCTSPLGCNLSVGTSLGKYLSLCSKVMAPNPRAHQRLCIFEVFYKHKPPYLVIAVCSPLILLMNSYK